jgi:hypothetical protein
MYTTCIYHEIVAEFKTFPTILQFSFMISDTIIFLKQYIS